MTFPFLYIEHGAISPECVDKCEEVFFWFSRPITQQERDKIMKDCPPPLSHVWHWDSEFVYFGSAGDTYEFEVIEGYIPKALKPKLDQLRKPEQYMEYYKLTQQYKDEAIEAFTEHLERWVEQVHKIAPLLLFWGPRSDDESDEWNQWSEANFSEIMADRLKNYKVQEDGEEYFGWIKDRCRALIVASSKSKKSAKPQEKSPAPKGAKSSKTDNKKSGTDKAKESIEDGCRAHRPTRLIERLTSDEGHLLELAQSISVYIGKTKTRWATLETFSPLAQLIYLASYQCEDEGAFHHYSPISKRIKALIGKVRADEKASVLHLVRMTAQTITHDSPAFDGYEKKHAAIAAELMQMAMPFGKPTPGTYARTARYLRWAGDLKGAQQMITQAEKKYGARPVLQRASARIKAAQN